MTARPPRAAIAIALLVVACGEGPLDPAPRRADRVIDAPGATGEGFGDPARATNGVRGGGETAGSLDVYSLDLGSRPHLVLGWGDGAIVRNGPGDDLVVFENAFRTLGVPDAAFMDPAVVAVSRDGATWVDLPHDYVAPDPTEHSTDPAHWVGFAGRTPVLFHEETNAVDPFDRAAAGGDAFDLDALPDDGGEASAIRREGFRYVRVTSAALAIDPDTGAPFPRDPASNGADVDGIVARWVDD